MDLTLWWLWWGTIIFLLSLYLAKELFWAWGNSVKPWLRRRQAPQERREGEWHPNMTSMEVFEYSLEARRKKNLRFHQTHGANTRCLLCFKTPPPSSAPPSTPGTATKLSQSPDASQD